MLEAWLLIRPLQGASSILLPSTANLRNNAIIYSKYETRFHSQPWSICLYCSRAFGKVDASGFWNSLPEFHPFVKRLRVLPSPLLDEMSTALRCHNCNSG